MHKKLGNIINDPKMYNIYLIWKRIMLHKFVVKNVKTYNFI